MGRAHLLTLALALGACATPVKEAPAPAHAEEQFAVWPPMMPAAIDLDNVPLGRWAEYEETYLGAVTIKERVALVAKGADGNTLETTTEMPGGSKTVFATVFTAGKEGAGQVVSNVFQVSEDEPMEAPPLAPGHAPYPRVDVSKLVGVDTIGTRVGSFRGRHYRDKTPFGEQVDFWIDETVGPLGLIKLEAEQKQHPTIRAGFRYDLVATGGSAIQQITKRASPFDPSLLKKRGLPWTRQTRVGPQPPAKVVQ